MVELASHILSMSDAEKAAWLTKAVHDCLNGCTDADADPFIKVQYDNTMNKIKAKQEYDARRHQQHKALSSGKPNTISANEAGNPPTRESETRGPQTDKFNGDAATSDGADAISTRESGSLEHTTISNISQDAPNGNAGDERRSGSNSVVTVNLVHPAPIAESARCATSEAVKALADASTREGEDERDHRGNTGILESSSSAKTLGEARESRRTGGTPKRVEMPTASHAETLPVRSPAELKKPYGTCGHVMLTDTEGRHLRELYGENLRIAIDILDAYIENGGKAAKKYKNHAAVMRKGNWVWEKVQKMVLDEKRIANAYRSGKSFKQMERDREANLMHSSLFAPSIDGTDNKRIANG